MTTFRTLLVAVALGAGAMLPARAEPVSVWDTPAQESGLDGSLLAPLHVDELRQPVAHEAPRRFADLGNDTGNLALYSRLAAHRGRVADLHGKEDRSNRVTDEHDHPLPGDDRGHHGELDDDPHVSAVPLPASLLLLLSGLAALLLVRLRASRITAG